MSEVTVFTEDGLQTTWDATSITLFDQCAYKWWLKQHQGWHLPSESADVEFGSLYGLGLETFYKAVIEAGKTHDEAVRDGVKAILFSSWDGAGGVPKTGRYMRVWRCTGTTKYKNEKGNNAKCPWSHKGKLYAVEYVPDPGTCSCGSPTEQTEQWSGNHPIKDRVQAVKAFVWYTEDQKGSLFNVCSLSYGPDGQEKHTACVEMGWRIPAGHILGHEFYLSGWFDTVKRLGELPETYACDFKSTKNSLGNAYFAQYDPNWQINLYQIAAAKVLPPELGVSGVGVEAMQILKEGVRFSFRLFPSSLEKAQELVADLAALLTRYVGYHQTGVYPRSRSSCYMCEFKPVCSAEPSAREHILKEKYVKRWWNPLKRVQQETRP